MKRMDGSRVDLIYSAICEKPGITMSDLSRLAYGNRYHGAIESALASLEERGILITEDGGKLYPFKSKEEA